MKKFSILDNYAKKYDLNRYVVSIKVDSKSFVIILRKTIEPNFTPHDWFENFEHELKSLPISCVFNYLCQSAH